MKSGYNSRRLLEWNKLSKAHEYLKMASIWLKVKNVVWLSPESLDLKQRAINRNHGTFNRTMSAG